MTRRPSPNQLFVAACCAVILALGLLGLGPVSRNPLRSSPLFQALPSDVLLGKARNARSDEFYSFTPRVVGLRQIEAIGAEGSDVNPLLGAGVPDNSSNVAQRSAGLVGLLLSPHSIAFHFAPGPWGYAVTLAFLEIFLLLTAWALLRVYGLSDIQPLLFGAALLSLGMSPHLERWLVSGIGFAFAYLGPLVFSAMMFMDARDKRRQLMAGLGLVWASACYAHIFYPPSLYALALVPLPALLVKARKEQRWLRLAAAAALFAVAAGLTMMLGLRTHIQDLHLTGLETRIFHGGEYPLRLLRNLLWPDLASAVSSSEDATAFLGPALIALVYAWRCVGRREGWSLIAQDRLARGLTLLCLFLGTWILLPIPGYAVKFLLLDKISAFRAITGFCTALTLLLFLALARITPALTHARQKKWVATWLVLQSLAVVVKGRLWNPVARVSAQEQVTANVELLRQRAAGGYALTSNDFVMGANLMPYGVRSLLGRFDSLAPELMAFLLSTQTQPFSPSTHTSDLHGHLFAFFYSLWDPSRTEAKAETDLNWVTLDACHPKLQQAGLRVIALSGAAAQAIVQRCPNRYREESLPEGDGRLLTMNDAQPLVFLESATGEHAALVSDSPWNVPSDNGFLAPSLARRIAVDIGRIGQAKEPLVYRYRWRGTGLEVEFEQVPRLQGWKLVTTLESRLVSDELQRPEPECRYLRTREDQSDLLRAMPASDFLARAGDCLFKRIPLEEGRARYLFRTREL